MLILVASYGHTLGYTVHCAREVAKALYKTEFDIVCWVNTYKGGCYQYLLIQFQEWTIQDTISHSNAEIVYFGFNLHLVLYCIGLLSML